MNRKISQLAELIYELLARKVRYVVLLDVYQR